MKKQLTLALDPGTLDALRARARQEHRSVSNLIQYWMSEAVSGVTPPAQAAAAPAGPASPAPTAPRAAA